MEEGKRSRRGGRALGEECRKNGVRCDVAAQSVHSVLRRAPQLRATVSVVAGAGPEPAYPTMM